MGGNQSKRRELLARPLREGMIVDLAFEIRRYGKRLGKGSLRGVLGGRRYRILPSACLEIAAATETDPDKVESEYYKWRTESESALAASFASYEPGTLGCIVYTVRSVDHRNSFDFHHFAKETGYADASADIYVKDGETQGDVFWVVGGPFQDEPGEGFFAWHDSFRANRPTREVEFKVLRDESPPDRSR